MSGKTYSNPVVKSLIEKHFVFVVLNVDQDKKTSDQMGIVGIPDTRILSADGKMLDQIMGFEGPEAFAERLRKHVAGQYR